MKKITHLTLLFLLSITFLSSSKIILAKDHDHHNHEHSEKKNQKHDDHEHDEHGGAKFGPGKAILEIKNDGEMFKLSPAAEQTMGINNQAPAATNQPYHFKVPKGSIVEYQDKIGIYRESHQWYELLDATIIHSTDNEAVIYSKRLKASDMIAVSGVGLLRVAHLEASGQGGEGHAH